MTARDRVTLAVVLQRHIFEIPAEQLREVRVAMTFVGGRKVFDMGG